jgi:hypothetical protein
MLSNLTYDDHDSPVIGLAPDGTTWQDVQDHIKITHSPVLVWVDGADGYNGAYWTGTALAVAADLGADRDEALSEFRDFLRERGEA